MEKFTRKSQKLWTIRRFVKIFWSPLGSVSTLKPHEMQAEWASAMLSVGVCRAAAVESFEGSMQSNLMCFDVICINL